MFNSNKFVKIKEMYYSKYFVWIIIFMGILIRFRQYMFNRSLWLDEAFLAINMLKLNYTGLLGPLLHGQAAPPLFLLITKLFTDIAGYNEYVLRFFPFLCGIISLLFFYQLAKHILQKQVIPLAISLLSFSYYAIYYSNEFKQYSVDLLFTILIIFFAFKLDEGKYQKKISIYFGFIAILSTWFSHTSIFVLAGVGSALLYKIFFEEGRFNKDIIHTNHFKKLALIGILSIISFILHYLYFIKPVPKEIFYEYWKDSFIPFPPLHLSEIKWYFSTTINIFKNPLGFSFLYGIAFIFLTIGLIGFWIKKEKLVFNLLFFPIVFLLIASIFHIYPINGRLILFIIPIVYLFISEGIYQFIKYLLPEKRFVAILIAIFLLFHPISVGFSYLLKPILNEEIKPVIKYCFDNKEVNDKIYLYHGAKASFEYYTRKDNICTLNSVGNNRKKPEEYLKDLDKLKGTGRVWFIFSHIVNDEEKIFLTYLNYIAVPLDSFQTVGSSIYLYKL